MMPGNNVGYFGKFEYLWRGPERGGHYHGCVAGINGMGIEADGTIKACPSLPKERYSCGSVKTSSIAEAWHGGDMNDWNRNRENREFEGYCQECYYKDVCRGGCTWMSDSLFGKAGNNPYCIHRVEQLKNRNIMELIEKVQEASNVPFATGRYRIVQKECS